MPWEVPITVGDQTYPVQFNTEAEPTQTDIDEAVAQILSGQQGQTAPAEVEDTGQGRFSSAMFNLGRGALSIIPGAIGGLGYLAEPVIGPGLKEVGEGIEQDIEKMLPVNPAYQDEFSQKAAGAVGQAIGMLGTGGVAGALGKGAAVARGLGAAEAAAAGTQLAGRTLLGSGFLSGSRQGGQAAEQYGMEGLSAYTRAILGGGIEYATEKYLFGLGTELAPVKKFLGDTLEKGVGGIAKMGATEAGEEAAAQAGGNIATKFLAPEGVETPGIGSGVGEAAALGGVAGLALGGVTGLLPSGEKTEPATAAESVTVESGEMPLPTVLKTLDEKVKAAVEANADVLPATKAALEGLESGLTDAGEGEGDVRQGLATRRKIAVPGQEGITDLGAPEGDVLSLVPKKSPAAPPAEPTDATEGQPPTPGGVGAPPVVTNEPQTPSPAEQPVSAAETPVATEPETPLPETEKVVAPKAEPEQGAGMTPKEWAKTLPDAQEGTGKPNETSSPQTGSFREGQITADQYGDDPYVYRDEWINVADYDPRVSEDFVGLEGVPYEVVARMPTTQQYVEWYRQGFVGPPITIVQNEISGRGKSNNRRRIVAALEAGVSRIPARVEIGRASQVMPVEGKTEQRASVKRDTSKPEQMTPKELFEFEKAQAISVAEENLRKAKKGEEAPYAYGFKSKAAFVKAREAELKTAQEYSRPPDIWSVVIEAKNNRVPVAVELVEGLSDDPRDGNGVDSPRKQLTDNLSDNGYVRQGDLYVFAPEAPTTKTEAQPKPQDASIQNEVQEAGGPTPVQGQPPETRPEGQAQEGASQRGREGEEGQVGPTPAPGAVSEAPVAAPPLARSEPKQETPKVTPTGKASPAEVVDLRRSAMDEERKRLGLPPLAQPIQKAIGDDQMYDLAMQEFEKNPLIGSTLVDMVNTRPRSLNSLEIAILGIEIANRRNAVDMADNAASADPKNQALQDEYQKAVARYDDAQQALPLGISDVGRALRLMRVLLEQDFSKEGLIRKFRQSSGGVAPNEQQVKEIEELSKEVLDAENKVEELRAARAENARLQETIDNMLTHMKANFVKELQAVEKANKEASEAIKTASKPGKGEKSSLAIWKEKILARRAERRKKVMADPFLFNALLDAFDDVLLGAIKIAEGIRNAAQWATEMREENPEFTEYTDDQLEEIRQASQAYYDSNLKGILAEEKAPKEKKTTKEKKEAEATEAETEELESEEEGEKVFATFDDVTARDVYHMVRDRVQKGMTKVEDVMKSVTEELKKQLPDVTERQVRDRFSGYGNPLFPSGGDIAKKVRELRTLAQYASKIEDAQRKIAPLRAGKQREAATDAIRAAQKELYRLMKDHGLEMASGNRAIKTPLDVVKSRLRNSIADLDRQIEAKKRDAKSTKVVERDTEAADLENQAKILREKLNEIDPPKQPSFQDKAKARMKSISKEIVSLRQKLANKDVTKPESEPIINQQIQVLLNERDALKQAMDELRLEIEGEPYLTQDEINERAEKILDRNIKSLETEIKELQDPNFYPQPAQKAENTPTIIRLKAQQEVLRKQRDELKTQRFGKKTKSQEDLLDAAIASAEKSINDLNDRINREETATKARTPKFVETAKLRNLRAERNSLRSVMFAMRKAKAEAAKDPVLEQIKRDRKYLETRTKYYEDMADKLRNGTYKPKVKEARKFNDSLGAELKRLDDAKMRVADIMLQQRLKNRSSLRKAFDFIGDLFSLQRVITATADLSAIANQGNFILFSNPRIAMKAIPDMLRAMRTEEGEKEVQERLRNVPSYKSGETKRIGLYMAMDAGPNAPVSKMEEQYASRLVAKWPKLLGGGLVRGSERAYKTLLDVIRLTSYEVMKESLVTGSIFRPPQQSTQENLESLANLINNATGRGVFKMKKADQLLSQAAPFLNTFIFAARFGISRFAMALGLPLWRASPQTRALIAEQYAKYIFGIYMATLLLSLGQDDDDEPIQLDFRSTDAGKLRFDDNRVDLLGGFQQPLVFLTRLLTGETVTAKGKLKPLREGDRPLDLFRDFPLKGKPSYGAMSGDSLIGSFLRFKLAPTTASILNALAGKDPVGNKTDLKSEIIKAPIPLQVSQIFEILGSQQDDPATAALLMGLGATGVRTTFQGKNAEKNKTAWDNMVNKVNELLGEK